MGCCGKGRNALTPTTKSTAVMKSRNEPVATPAARSAESVQGSSVPTFQYIGSTGLTVRGPVSGKTYRFARTGSTVVVDERDAPYFGGVPSLRKVPFIS
jgi:hypothetical protein